MSNMKLDVTDIGAKVASQESSLAPAILDKLKGAEADPGRIGQEYMPEEIDGVIIGLADTTGLILPPGRLGVDASGNLVQHDGITPGGNAVAQSGFFRRKGSVIKTAGQMAAAVNDVIAEFPIAAANAVPGKILRIRGSLWGRSAGASPIARVGISTVQQRTATSGNITPSVLTGIPLPATDPATAWHQDVDFAATLTTNTTYLDLVAVPNQTPDILTNAVSASIALLSANTSSISTLTRFTPNASESIRLYFSTQTAFTSQAFRLYYDLEFSWE